MLKLPVLCYIKVANVDNLVLFQSEEKYFQLFCLQYNTGHWFVICSLTILRNIPSVSSLWRCFHVTWCWMLSKVFSASIQITTWFLFFILVMWFMFIDLQILNNRCISGINPTSLWYVILLICLRIFATTFISDQVCSFLFCHMFTWFEYESNIGLI